MTNPPGYISPNAPQSQNPPPNPNQSHSGQPHSGQPHPRQPQFGQQPPYGPDAAVPPTPTPTPTPPPEKEKSWFARHKVLTVVGVVLVLIVGANLISGGDEGTPEAGGGAAASQPADNGAGAAEPDTAQAGTEKAGTEKAGTGKADTAEADEADAARADAAEDVPETAPEAPANAMPGIGDTVTSGKFEFTVISVETGVTEVGNQYLSATPQGQFVLVELSATNVGKKAEYLFDSNQRLFDTEDRQHSSDTTAAIYLEDNDVVFTEINPGNTLTGTVVFDIPVDAVPTTIELSGSMIGKGVKVSLAD